MIISPFIVSIQQLSLITTLSLSSLSIDLSEYDIHRSDHCDDVSDESHVTYVVDGSQMGETGGTDEGADKEGIR